MPASLGSGAYVSNYTVTSVDGHVVSGGIVFLAGNVKAGSITVLARPKTTLTNWVDDFGQFLVYLGVLVAGGLAFFVAFVLRGGAEERRLRRVDLRRGGGRRRRDGGDRRRAVGADWGRGGLDRALEHRAAVLRRQVRPAVRRPARGAGVCVLSFGLRTTMTRQFAAFYGLVIAAGAFVLFGHALVSPERWLSTPADVVHVVLAAMWAGGLVGLLMVLRTRLRRRAGRASSLAGSGPGELADPAIPWRHQPADQRGGQCCRHRVPRRPPVGASADARRARGGREPGVGQR